MLNFLIFSSLFLKLLAQPNFEAVKENLVEIKSIDIYDEGYLGYESFKQEIGNKTIVMLGAQRSSLRSLAMNLQPLPCLTETHPPHLTHDPEPAHQEREPDL